MTKTSTALWKTLFRRAPFLVAPLLLSGCLATSPLGVSEADTNRDGLWDSVEWDLAQTKMAEKYDARPVRLMALHYQLKLKHPKYVDTVRYGAPSMYARASACLVHLYGEAAAPQIRREINQAVINVFFGDASKTLVSPRLTLRRQQHALVDKHWQTYERVPVPANEEACQDYYRGGDTFDRY